MALWQRAAIRVAQSTAAKRFLQPLIGRTLLARRFVDFATADAAVAAAVTLHEELGVSASLFYLGEYIDDPSRAEETVRQSCRIGELLGRSGLDVHISVDPTAIGFMTSEQLCKQNAERIAGTVAAHARGRSYLMLDMEDLRLLPPTLELLRHLLALRLPSGITLQARLRRTASDLAPILDTPAGVRLVKGAFPLGPEDDYQGASAIDQNFLALADMMLSPQAKRAGLYPSFATHDDRLGRAVVAMASERGWLPSEYEIEFLYGVRSDWLRQLRQMGVPVRVYLPFGTDWWPYVMRRLGENPRNALLVARPMLSRDARLVTRSSR
jgi:proline dehydrogenase